MGHLFTASAARLFQQLDTSVDDLFDDLVRWRRHLHMHPELSWNELQTTEFVLQHLEEMGLEPRRGPRDLGCIVDLAAGHSPVGSTIAVRGDLDGIPVVEANDFDYASKNSCAMHACGHDVHTALLLGVCASLGRLSKAAEIPFPVSMRAIFQPAEEVAQGARAMIDAGVLDGVDMILAVHADPHRSIGHVGLKTDVQTARCDEIRVKIMAEGGHGARPHETTDPIYTACQFVNAVYSSAPRSIDSRHPAVLTFCQMIGGKSANVIPTEVELHGTLRSLDESARVRILDQVESLASSLGLAFGGQIHVDYGVSVPSIKNASRAVDLLRSAAESFLDRSAIDQVAPSMGSEDFALYLQQTDGAMARLGCANPQRGFHPLHSPHFDVDEEILRIGCKLLARSVLIWNHPDLLLPPAS